MVTKCGVKTCDRAAVAVVDWPTVPQFPVCHSHGLQMTKCATSMSVHLNVEALPAAPNVALARQFAQELSVG